MTDNLTTLVHALAAAADAGHVAFSDEEVERHPLFQLCLMLAEVGDQMLSPDVEKPSPAEINKLLDATRVLWVRDCTTNNPLLDSFMLESIRCFRDQLTKILKLPRLPDDDSMSCSDDDSQREAAALARGHSLPASAVEVLKTWLEQHAKYPYPDGEEKKRLAQQTNLSVLQVNYWFTNARRRYLPRMTASQGPAASTAKRAGQASDTRDDDIKAWFRG
jgi:hypothetical protein